jgi:hypothetical protein
MLWQFASPHSDRQIRCSLNRWRKEVFSYLCESIVNRIFLKIHKLFILFVVAFLAVSGCKKYPDGPYISLLPKNYRLAEDWRKNKIYKNGNDISTEYLTHIRHESLNVDKRGNFNYYLTSDTGYLTYGGSWTFSPDKTVIYFSYFLGAQSMNDVFLILRLKEHDLWLQQTTAGGDVMEYHYIPN